MWIKICGMTTAAAVAAALEAHVEAIGFVFARSVRELVPESAAALARPARGRARCVAVTRHPTQAAVDEIVRVLAPDLLQSDAEDLARLRLPASLETLPVVRDTGVLPLPLPGRMLFEGPTSGVEERPGVKSPAAIMSFVEAVRGAHVAVPAARGV